MENVFRGTLLSDITCLACLEASTLLGRSGIEFVELDNPEDLDHQELMETIGTIQLPSLIIEYKDHTVEFLRGLSEIKEFLNN